MTASHLLVRALAIREKYMTASHQEFSSNVERSAKNEEERVLVMHSNIPSLGISPP